MAQAGSQAQAGGREQASHRESAGGGAQAGEAVARMDAIGDIQERKLALLGRMCAISESESLYATEDGVECLGNVLQERQGLISDIDHLDRRFLAEFEALKRALGVETLEEADASALGGSDRAEAMRRRTEKTVGLLRRIEAADRVSSARVAALRDSLAQDIVRLRKQRHINSIYGNEAAARGRKGRAAAPAAGAPRPMFDRKK